VLLLVLLLQACAGGANVPAGAAGDASQLPEQSWVQLQVPDAWRPQTDELLVLLLMCPLLLPALHALLLLLLHCAELSQTAEPS
jgi:hypothetical protein